MYRLRLNYGNYGFAAERNLLLRTPLALTRLPVDQPGVSEHEIGRHMALSRHMCRRVESRVVARRCLR